jgi:hypothetical protein
MTIPAWPRVTVCSDTSLAKSKRSYFVFRAAQNRTNRKRHHVNLQLEERRMNELSITLSEAETLNITTANANQRALGENQRTQKWRAH